MSGVVKSVWNNRKTIVFFGLPILLMPLPIAVPTPPAQVAYMMIIMGAYWVTEALPIGVTALIPVVAMPLFRVVTSKEICVSYFEDTNLLFIGGLILAISIEYWNLHKRLALNVLSFFGVQPKWLLLGFMLPTWFMSMWISNTAATAMMLPIIEAVLQQLRLHHQRLRAGGEDHLEDGDVTTQEYIAQAENEDFAKVCKMLTISVAYAANIGGIGTLTGTGPNLVLNNNVDSALGNGHPFNFLTWMMFALPISLLCLVIAWLWLQILYLGPRNLVKRSGRDDAETAAVRDTFRKQRDDLGPITYQEVCCIIVFSITVLLWLTKQVGSFGWSQFFTRNVTVPATGSNSSKAGEQQWRVQSYMADAQPAIAMAILLFILPSRNPFRRQAASVDVMVDETELGASGQTVRKTRTIPDSTKIDWPSTLLTWKIVQQQLPWGIVLLLGGGFALAKATKESGLSLIIGEQLQPLGSLPTALLTLVIIYCTTFVTEITSNTATASIFLPILADLCRKIGINPLALMLPCTTAASLAFNLPVSTPPNSIVFSKGYLTVPDMIKSGFPLTILCSLIVLCGTLLHGSAIFSLTTVPDWAKAE